MTRLNYASRTMGGTELGEIVARDLKDKFLVTPRPRTQGVLTIEIDLSKNRRRDGVATDALTDKGFKAFVDTLLKCLKFPHEFQLLELRLSHNELTVGSLPALTKVIKLSTDSLRDLDLSYNAIEVGGPKEGKVWEDFLKTFERSAMLKRVNFSGNPLGSFGMELLARTYMQSPFEVMEDREGNECLRGLRSIPYLILADIDFSPAAVIHLASMLTIQKPRRELREYLPDTMPIITNEEALGICESIIWLPNEHLNAKKRDFFICASKMADDLPMPRRESDFNGARKLRSPDRNASALGQELMERYQAKRVADYLGHRQEVLIEALKDDIQSCALWEAAWTTLVVCKILLIQWQFSKQRMTYASVTRGYPEAYDMHFPSLMDLSIHPKAQVLLRGLPRASRDAIKTIARSVKTLPIIPKDRWYGKISWSIGTAHILTFDQHHRIMEYARSCTTPVESMTEGMRMSFLTTVECLVYNH